MLYIENQKNAEWLGLEDKKGGFYGPECGC
jgi:hypothetical protein